MVIKPTSVTLGIGKKNENLVHEADEREGLLYRYIVPVLTRSINYSGRW